MKKARSPAGTPGQVSASGVVLVHEDMGRRYRRRPAGREAEARRRRTHHAESDQGERRAKAAGAGSEPLRHRGLVSAPDAVLQPIVKRLDEAIRATIPGLQYAVKWKRPYYGLPELGWIIELAAYDVSVNVVFLGGADFKSPPPLGTTDRTRYVKVATVEDVQQPELQKWIEEAARTPGWR